MPRLDIQRGMVWELILEMAPQVERLTGWDLALSSLGVRVLPRSRGYEEILLARLRGAGPAVRDDGPRDLLERLVEYVVENVVLAAYDPAAQQVCVVRENVDDSNLDGLRLVLAHELVHRGQHVQHPGLFDRVNRIVRAAAESVMRGGSFADAMRTMQEVQPIMTLMESHAWHVQELLRERMPGARIESHFNLPSLLMRVFGRRKLSQYRGKVPAVRQAMADGTIQDLYANMQAADPS